jgi:hypothetical protein
VITALQWRKIVTPVLGPGPDWKSRGKLTYRTPVDWVLLAVHGEGSGHRSGHVYISAVAMPLFVPAEHLTLNYSTRVPSGTAVFALDNPEAFRSAIQQAMAELPSQQDALRAIAASQTEESPYAYLLLGEVALAQRRFVMPFFPDDERAFVNEARLRRFEISELLRLSGPESAVQRLRTWRDTTASNIGVL